MSRVVAVVRPGAPALADVVALVKPNIMLFSLLTAVGGMSLAPGTPAVGTWLALLVGTGLIVGSANTLNMYLERDIDCLMSRTRNRPLPGGRMDPRFALVFGVAQAALSVPLLTFGANPLTGFLGVVALISYVNFYTPLKQRTTLATLVGALPGAMPPLMGFTAATNRLELGGLAVFGLLFLWQIPHFHAIALYRFKEYDRAGLKILPAQRGEMGTRITMLIYLIAQVAVSVLVYATGVAGVWYLATALVLGLAYLAYGVLGLRRDTGPRWARRFFLASIVYLPVLFIVLVLDGIN
ncbi:MAG TPA: heme o synthase [Kofleriaceae bacterium]|nr:heme o synthase [Kofleriaceae bacterium]